VGSLDITIYMYIYIYIYIYLCTCPDVFVQFDAIVLNCMNVCVCVSVCDGFRPSQVNHPTHRSRQSLNSPSPGGTEMDLLVMRERPRKGIRNSGYDVSVFREKHYNALAICIKWKGFKNNWQSMESATGCGFG